MRKRYNRKRKKRFRRFIIIVLILSGALFAFCKIEPRTFHNWKNSIVRFVTFSEKKQKKLPQEQPTEVLEAVEPNGVLYKDILWKHQIAARNSGVDVIENEEQLEHLVARNKLLVVEDGKGFLIGEMTHSYPFLEPEALKTLRKIGLSFYRYSGDSSAIAVTSITRTEETQQKLRRYNRNATRKESTHTRGVSFDISYIRYNGVKDWNLEYTKTLEGILAALQASGEIYVIKERNQNCFHVTVRKKD